MSKFKYLYILLLSVLFSLGVFPFLNGLGCNAVLEMDTVYFNMKGRCENGYIESVFYNKPLQESYTLSGHILVLGGQYFIFVDKFKYIEQNSNKADSMMKRHLFYRKIMSGKIISNQYILTYTPFALMGEIKITGKLSIL